MKIVHHGPENMLKDHLTDLANFPVLFELGKLSSLCVMTKRLGGVHTMRRASNRQVVESRKRHEMAQPELMCSCVAWILK